MALPGIALKKYARHGLTAVSLVFAILRAWQSKQPGQILRVVASDHCRDARDDVLDVLPLGADGGQVVDLPVTFEDVANHLFLAARTLIDEPLANRRRIARIGNQVRLVQQPVEMNAGPTAHDDGRPR